VQDVCPDDPWYLPAMHGSQTVGATAAADAYFPATQTWQTLMAIACVTDPGAHVVHVDSPVDPPYCPALQGVQAVVATALAM
jgi:hypothetical protein